MSRIVRLSQLPANFRNSEHYKEYTEKHWGKEPEAVMVFDDGMDVILDAWGLAVELHVREPRKLRDTVIKLTKTEANGSALSYDKHHPHQRMYVNMHPKFMERMRETYINSKKKNPAKTYGFMPLSQIAKLTDGRHATRDYPKVEVTPIGALTHVMYACEKIPDGYSFYIHELGEETGILPFLCVDKTGQLWIAGGDYWGETGGINN